MQDSKSTMALAIESLRSLDFDQTEALCRQVLHVEPENPAAWHLCGIAHAQQDEFLQATECFEKAVQLAPDTANYRYNLGLAYRRQDRLDEAVECYRKVLELDPEMFEARNNLGNALIDLGNTDEAVICYREFVERYPDNGIGHFNLGNVLQDVGEYQDSISHLRRAIELDPDFETARENLGRTLAGIHEFENALEVWNAWLEHDPGNAVARHMAAAIQGDNGGARCNDDYIRGVFDEDFAATFDQQLARVEYRGPELMAQALQALDPPPASAEVLDAGCGTGLSAEILRPLSGKLVGIDLSADMLRNARNRKLYDQLVEAEITDYLQSHPDSFDMVICSDTLCYFGELNEVFSATAECLRNNGVFIFSLERRVRNEDKDADGNDEETEARQYELKPHGRYCHDESYVRDAVAAAGLTISRMVHETLRIERGRAVNGLVVTASLSST
jgi:predicted TPR repeat methyltransferase